MAVAVRRTAFTPMGHNQSSTCSRMPAGAAATAAALIQLIKDLPLLVTGRLCSRFTPRPMQELRLLQHHQQGAAVGSKLLAGLVLGKDTGCQGHKVQQAHSMPPQRQQHLQQLVV